MGRRDRGWREEREGGLYCFVTVRRPTRSTESRSSAASDVYKRQVRVEALVAGRRQVYLTCRHGAGIGRYTAQREVCLFYTFPCSRD